MSRQSVQAPKAVVMIRPHHFWPNSMTASDNSFQSNAEQRSAAAIASRAFEEVTRMAEGLADAGVTVHVFEDKTTLTPDSVFPNNWFSTHSGGHVAIYPIYSASRQKERRNDVIEMLKCEYRVQDVIDYSGLEKDRVFLEGTGAMVLDHIGRVAYAVRSNRTNEVALERFCTHFNFEPMVFDAQDRSGKPIYHTNVLMCIGTDFALLGTQMVPDIRRRQEIVARLAETGRQVIELSLGQIESFVGNAIELEGRERRIVALSARAQAVIDDRQREALERSAKLLAFDVSTIELAGGSVRCMLAGIHLSRRAAQTGHLLFAAE
ncbi:MAG: amidinotransferase [Mesorhizobium sp.]|uniref:citrulline utilization hydrolase CtlX n=1 Tax=Mesorhizobium sp. TaxID=1871066 RepID=UPI000FE994F3|nr:arginine deiminase-related protein [Mesorhizobium sp.]RWH21128.1 MAG: amidinotransferase [Mesorhizobium sp.]RWH38664.1 MAG: amidinotransferase [Mesorhizobium sp.]TIM70882.1 MAG: amidinotransferase [Mesorhizobium sp.]TIO05247.1 MAG: amidinotransferase [Mesorhizobium sp.]TIR61903.1 MAG: amidinotransferase [Mesorhizobium sp.]